MTIQFENQHLLFGLDCDGVCRSFVDRGAGENYASGAPFAWVKQHDKLCKVSKVERAGERLRLEFDDTGIAAMLKIAVRDCYLLVEVLSVEGEGVDEFVFVDIPLSLQGELGEPFAACALALDLQTRVVELPGPGNRLRAACYARFGLAGARAALIGCPADGLRGVLQQVVSAELRLPYSTIGGPWAMDQAINKGSYLFNFDGVTVETVDEWIGLIRTLGFDQLDFHGGRSFRFGDCRPDPQQYPAGFADLKAAIDRLHAAGIAAGLHTYAFFIDKTCPWVTPTPDPRLARDASFTLAEPLAAEADEVRVRESTAGMSATTGFFVRNSATLQIGDELLTYTGLRQEPPYAFTGCRRGACGTRIAAHSPGARVDHLKECFGLFVPDPDSTLLAEVAERTAAAFNECGFDMIYLDALDGEDVLGGPENGWHYGSRFVFELWKRLKRPALMEMSTFHHHLWYVRSRMGAWDHPQRSHKRFIDIHCQANQGCNRMFLPANLGWWAVKTWNGAPGEPTFADDIEYLCAKALGTDSGLSLMGIDPDNAANVPALPRLAALIRQWETLRRSGQTSASVKARLAQPGAEFSLERAPDGKQGFRPMHYVRHRVERLKPWSNVWMVDNPFAAQPAGLRIEALLGAGPYGAPDNLVLADFADPDAFADRRTAAEIRVELERAGDGGPVDRAGGRLCAFSARPARQGAWAQLGRTFDPPLDLSRHQGLGVWIHGDGKGQVLNFQLRSPQHLSHAIGEHYAIIDFVGWRYFELIEPEGERYAAYTWPYGSPYAIYRESIDYGQVGSLDLWYNALPPGDSVACSLSPIEALPLVELTLANPEVAIGGQRLVFPVELRSGCYLEFQPPAAYRLYGPQGELLEEGTAAGEAPRLAAGENQVTFTCEVAEGIKPRARVTTICKGDLFR